MLDDLLAAGYTLLLRLAPSHDDVAPGMTDPRRIEEAGLNALQTQRQLFYDGWLLRLSAGKAKRARSVNAHFGSTLPVDRKIEYCERVYAQHGLAPLFRMTPFDRPAELEAALGTTRLRCVRGDARPGSRARAGARASGRPRGRLDRAARRRRVRGRGRRIAQFLLRPARRPSRTPPEFAAREALHRRARGRASRLHRAGRDRG